MARKKVVAQSAKNQVSELDSLIPAYGESKSKLDVIDKECKSLNAQIKDIMSNSKLDKHEAGGYVAKYTVQVRESMNDDKLLELLRQDYAVYQKLGIIKTKEYVDMDALETAIYNGKIKKEMLLKMDTCRETKEIPTLRISAVKEK